MDRRRFLKVTGRSLGVGALYAVALGLVAIAEGQEMARLLGRRNGERPEPFTFFQLSDTHMARSAPGHSSARSRSSTASRRRRSSSSSPAT